ncbi:MAG: SapC family protein [Magnetococcus sp. YQC-5]
MSQLIFYQKAEPIHKDFHRQIRLDRNPTDFSFARHTNSVMLAGIEFQLAAKEYPIVFVKANQDNIFATALLGVRSDENLFTDQEGRWDAQYIPAFVRRYPFILAEVENMPNQLTLCMDSDYPGFSTNQGEALFQENGDPSEMLTKTLQFLRDCHDGYQRTQLFIKRLQDLDLFVTLTTAIEMPDGRKFAIQGLMAVDENKLLALNEQHAMEMFRLGEMAWIYTHLLSLSNINRLAQLLTTRTANEPLSRKA